jgi:exosortase family protein XrtF
MKPGILQEFKPAIIFLVKFIALYLIGNVAYGLYITYFSPYPDPVTSWVTEQSSGILHLLGYNTETSIQIGKPNVLVSLEGKSIIAVFEGCNGLNVMIIFVAFLIAFGPLGKKILWFIPAGLIVVHLANLFRIIILFFIALSYPDYLYFLHKYFFTAFLYLIVFVFWYFWVSRMQPTKKSS